MQTLCNTNSLAGQPDVHRCVPLKQVMARLVLFCHYQSQPIGNATRGRFRHRRKKQSSTSAALWTQTCRKNVSDPPQLNIALKQAGFKALCF